MKSGGVASISIDPRFFEVGAAQSSRYPKLWTIAKETVQNSRDAGAKNIEFFISEDGEWVTIIDDGPGMGPTGGIENFLRLGRSEKNGSSSVGYFSTAKVRICFIHPDWEITTNNQRLSKTMLGNSPVEQTAVPFNGCRIRVKTDEEWDAGDIRSYLSTCNLGSIKAHVNGRRYTRTYRRGTLKATYSWAEIYVNRGDKAHKGWLIVRVDGLTMFTQQLPNVPAQVTVELSPEVSHHVLQENREALVWKAVIDGRRFYPSNELQEFVRGLIVNPRSARTKKRTVIELIKGAQRAIKPLQASFSAASEATMSNRREQVEFKGFEVVTAEVDEAETLREIVRNHDIEVPVTFGEGEQALTISAKAVSLGVKSMNVIDATDVPELTEFEEIFPYDYVVKHTGKRPKPHTKHARILVAWHSLLTELCKMNGLTEEFGVGLLVGQEGVTAEHADTDFGVFFLIDPKQYKATGAQLPQTIKMLKSACHEITHALGHWDHDEDFIAAETRVFSEALENLNALRECTKGLTVYSRGYGYN